MLKLIRRQALSFFTQTKGQGMAEYALLLGLVAVVVIAVLVFLGPAIAAKFQQIINALNPPA